MLLINDPASDHRHGHRGGVPPARRKSPEMGLRRRFVRKMEGLRIVFAGELEHFVARYFIGSEFALRADHEVFEIDHEGRA